MGMYRYISNRTLANKEGEDKGKIKVAVKKGSDVLEGSFKCPECSFDGTVNQEFKRPLNVKCSNCGFLMRLPKLKGKKV